MTELGLRLKQAALRHAAYRRTLAELKAMPLDTMRDLDIAPRDLDRLARTAVYGA